MGPTVVVLKQEGGWTGGALMKSVMVSGDTGAPKECEPDVSATIPRLCHEDAHYAYAELGNDSELEQ